MSLHCLIKNIVQVPVRSSIVVLRHNVIGEVDSPCEKSDLMLLFLRCIDFMNNLAVLWTDETHSIVTPSYSKQLTYLTSQRESSSMMPVGMTNRTVWLPMYLLDCQGLFLTRRTNYSLAIQPIYIDLFFCGCQC